MVEKKKVAVEEKKPLNRNADHEISSFINHCALIIVYTLERRKDRSGKSILIKALDVTNKADIDFIILI